MTETNNFEIENTNQESYFLLQSESSALRYKEEDGRMFFHTFCSKTFHNNLIFIDDSLPQIIRRTYELACFEHYTTFRRITEQLAEENILEAHYTDQKLFYAHKINEFLMAAAQGMTPDKTWNGRYDPYLTIDIPRQNQPPCQLRFLDYNAAEDYLFAHSYLKASQTAPYNSNGQCYININIEIGVREE